MQTEHEDRKSDEASQEPAKEVQASKSRVESRTPAQLIPTPSGSGQSDQREHGAMQAKPNWCEKVTVFIEVAGIVGLGIYCWYTFKEWRVFDSERQTMELELKEVRQNSKLEQRPWLGPQKPTTTGTMQQTNVVISIAFKNTGRTPAINVQKVVGWLNTLDAIPKPTMYPNEADTISSIVMPNEDFPFEEPMPPFNQAQIQSGQKVYFYLCVWYDDVFGTRHWTSVCYWVTPNMRFQFAKSGNGCDTNSIAQ